MNKQFWTAEQTAYLAAHYADETMAQLEQATGHTARSIENKAHALRLRKSKAFLAELGRQHSQRPAAIASRFKKGQVPFNKGKREWQFRSREGIEKVRQTQFKPGHQPHNTRPVGYERTDKEGYVMVKVEGRRKMVHKHRHLWEQANGPVPDGYCVTFADGDRRNCTLENLRLVSRAEAARQVINSETPERRAARTARANETRNATIRRDRIRIHWGFEPKTRLVKRW